MSASFNEHTQLVEALLQGDPDLAAVRLRQHILVQGERFADLLASLASLRAKTSATQAAEPSAEHTVTT